MKETVQDEQTVSSSSSEASCSPSPQEQSSQSRYRQSIAAISAQCTSLKSVKPALSSIAKVS